jgi:hypothetical protein
MLMVIVVILINVFDMPPHARGAVSHACPGVDELIWSLAESRGYYIYRCSDSWKFRLLDFWIVDLSA